MNDTITLQSDIESRSTETHTVRIAFQRTEVSARVYIVREAGINGRVQVFYADGSLYAASQAFGQSAASTVFALEDASTAGDAIRVVQALIPGAFLHSAPLKIRA